MDIDYFALAVALARADAERVLNAPVCRWCGSRDLGEDALGRGVRCYTCFRFQRIVEPEKEEVGHDAA